MPNIVERFEFICETDKHRYYVSNQGYVLSVSSKSFKERRLTGYVKQGRKSAPYVIKIGKQEKCIKHLVAQAFLPDYKNNKSVVLHKDGNKKNCHADNLIVVSKRQVNQITGPLSRSQKIAVTDSQGKETVYSSIRKAAIALNCSYQTLLDYMKGGYKSSVLDGYRIVKV